MFWKNFSSKSNDGHARRKAIERMAGDPKHIDALVACLADKTPAVRHAAAQALAKYGEFDFASDKQQKGVLQALVRTLRDQNIEVRQCAALALRKLGWKPAADQERAIFEIALGNPRGALFAGEAAIAPLLAELKHQHPHQRQAAAEALEFLHDPQVLWPLLAAANDADPLVRLAALRAVAKDPSEQVTAALLQALFDLDLRVRLAAAEELYSRGDPAHADNFVALLTDKNFEIRLIAIRFLAKLRDAKMLEHILPRLADTDADVRITVIKVLGDMHNPVFIEPLILKLVDEERSVRDATLVALNRIDPKWMLTDEAARAIGKLQEKMKDSQPWVRLAAATIITKIKGGEGPDAWKATVISIVPDDLPKGGGGVPPPLPPPLPS